MDSVLQDLKHAIRQLLKSRGFAAIAILTLAVGIGANTAIFSVVNGILLRPLPYPESDRLVWANYMQNGEYLVLRERSRLLRGSALYGSTAFNLSGEGEAERVQGGYASANLFSVLGVDPLRGRGFLPEEGEPGSELVAVIGESLWRQRFGANSDLIGSEILVNGQLRTVVGVMPAGFRFPHAEAQLWLPRRFDRSDPVDLWGGAGGQVVARLSAEVTPAQAQAELRALAPEFREANTLWVPPPDWGEDGEVVGLQERIVGDVRARLLVLLGAVAFVLLIGCANVANLLLARAAIRRREVAIRTAVGAGRGRIVRQLLTESAILGLLGGSLGLLLATWGLQLLVGSLPADMPRAAEIGIDRWVLGFTLTVSILASFAFGLVPALRSSSLDVQAALKAGGGGSSAAHQRLTGALVVGEFAVAVVLVTGAGLLIRSFAELVRVDPGFRTESVVTARITPSASQYDDDASLRAFYSDVLARVSSLPGVEGVDAVSQLPLSGGFGGFAFETEDDPYQDGEAAPTTADLRITPGYLQTMGIPLLGGRPLTEADREGAARVALINETFAQRSWPGEDPVGKRFKEVWLDDWTTVVGVVGDVRSSGLASETDLEIYRPFSQLPVRDMSLVARTSDDPAPLTANLREVVAAVDADAPVSRIRTAEQIVSTSVADSRSTMALLAAFAAAALLLAAVGVYGVISYAVSRRTRELGLRIAMGAQRAMVLRLVLKHALVLAGAGAVVGLAAALAVTRFLESLLFGVSATDAVTLVIVPLLLVAVALVAAYVPAWRAARVDPVIALRAE